MLPFKALQVPAVGASPKSVRPFLVRTPQGASDHASMHCGLGWKGQANKSELLLLNGTVLVYINHLLNCFISTCQIGQSAVIRYVLINAVSQQYMLLFSNE